MSQVDYIVKQIITELRSVETDTVKLGDEVHFEINLTNAGLSPSDNTHANIKFTYQVNKPIKIKIEKYIEDLKPDTVLLTSK